MSTIYVPQDTEKNIVLTLSSKQAFINGNETNIVSSNNSIGPIRDTDVINVSFTVIPFDVQTNQQFSFSSDPTNTYTVTASIISNNANSVPTGISGSLSSSNGSYTYTLSGNVSQLSYTYYSIVVRFVLSVYDSKNNLTGQNFTDESITISTTESTDISFNWDSNWLNSLPKITSSGQTYAYVLTQVGIGAYINNSILISSNQNISNMLNFDIQEFVKPPVPIILNWGNQIIESSDSDVNANVPSGIVIEQDGSFGGNVSVTNSSGFYFFHISASIILNGVTYYGTPGSNIDTRNTLFCVVVGNYFENNFNNQIQWNTPAGNLGDIYEGYYSYFGVDAVTLDGSNLTYLLAPYSELPSGLYIDPDGYISGRIPFVDSQTKVSFTIRASSGQLYSDRTFYFTILQSFYSDEYFNLKLPIYLEQTDRIKNIQSLITENIFRSSDVNYGICSELFPYFISGLKSNDDILGYWDTTLDSSNSLYGVGQNVSVITKSNYNNFEYCLIDKLRNYHKPFIVTISALKYSKMYSVDNEYVCDVVYFELTDRYESSYFPEDIEILEKNSNNRMYTTDTFKSNDAFTKKRIFLPAIENCRKDLILTENRIDTPTTALRPNSKSGIGLVGNEGLPFWMRNSDGTNSPIGYVASIVLMYVNKNCGNDTVNKIINDDQYKDIIGLSWVIDRYVYESNTKTYTTFDGDTTTFDGDTTLFDVSEGYNKEYVFFPEKGEIKNGV